MAGKKTESVGVKPADLQDKNQTDEALVADNATEEVVAETSATITSDAEIEARADEKLAELGATAEEVTAEAEPTEDDEWKVSKELAETIFEQYSDKNEVFITHDAQAFWLEDHAASFNSKYRKFER